MAEIPGMTTQLMNKNTRSALGISIADILKKKTNEKGKFRAKER